MTADIQTPETRPLPSPRIPLSKSKYLFATLNVGDSIGVPAEEAVTACSAMKYCARRLGRQFIRRTDPVNRGLVFWRTS